MKFERRGKIICNFTNNVGIKRIYGGCKNKDCARIKFYLCGLSPIYTCRYLDKVKSGFSPASWDCTKIGYATVYCKQLVLNKPKEEPVAHFCCWSDGWCKMERCVSPENPHQNMECEHLTKYHPQTNESIDSYLKRDL